MGPCAALVTAILFWIGQTERMALIGGFIGLFLSGVLLLYVASNWIAKGEFVFQIDDTGVEQVIPARGCGETFRISLQELQYALHVVSDGSQELLLVGKYDRRHEVTINYGNPLNQIIATLKALDIPVK